MLPGRGDARGCRDGNDAIKPTGPPIEHRGDADQPGLMQRRQPEGRGAAGCRAVHQWSRRPADFIAGHEVLMPSPPAHRRERRPYRPNKAPLKRSPCDLSRMPTDAGKGRLRAI